MTKQLLVSVNCITYNHEDYIEETIKSFLMQETTFDFEILIHDDASTDGTAEIIKKYEKMYPSIIKPIYQKENQYSKGKKPSIINQKRALGKYIAFCEGDDYWTDTQKLQKQVDILELNNELVASFHAVQEVNINKDFIKKLAPSYITKNFQYGVKDIIRFDGRIIHLSSIVFRKKFFWYKKIPDFFFNSPAGDLSMMLILSLSGNFHFSPETMSCTRRNVTNGASNKLFKNSSSFISTNRQIIEVYNEFNKISKQKYSEDIRKVRDYRKYQILIREKDIRKILNSEFYRKSNYYQKVKLLFYLIIK